MQKLDDRKLEAQKNMDEIFESFDSMEVKMKDLRTQFKKDKKEARKARVEQRSSVNMQGVEDNSGQN